MTQAAPISTTQDAPGPVTSRAGLARFMRRICSEIGAERYMLAEPSVERGPKSVRIITSNWIFDALEDLGTSGIAAIIESGYATCAGMPPRAIVTAETGFLSSEEKRALRDHGHVEVYCQKLDVARTRIFALFSGDVSHRIDGAALMRAHMACRYALNQYFTASGSRASRDPLSERERECLAWVSQGKTTDEVALILGVSSNTVNSYVAHAIQKFGASNRAMAIATAIRSGII
jgi:DNA-binding CsgD family transcriptional regulator